MRGLINCDALSVLVGQRVASFPANLDRTTAIKAADYMIDHQKDLLITDSVSRALPELVGSHADINDAACILAIQLSGSPAITIICLLRRPLEERLQRGEMDRESIMGDFALPSLHEVRIGH